MILALALLGNGVFPEVFLEELTRLSPWVFLRGPNEVVLECAQIQHLTPLPELLLATLNKAKAQGVTLTGAGFGSSACEAFLNLKNLETTEKILELQPEGGRDQWRRTPLERAEYFFSPLKNWTPEERKAWRQALLLFKGLGVRTLGDLEKKGLRRLASKFSKWTRRFQAFVVDREGSEWPWPLYQVPLEIRESISWVSPEYLSAASSLDEWFSGVETVLQKIEMRLQTREEALLKVSLHFETDRLEGQLHAKFEVLFSVPQIDAREMAKRLRESIEARIRKRHFPHSVYGVSVWASEVISRRQLQHDFFQKNSVKESEWETLYSRMAEKLGEGKIFRFKAKSSHLPEEVFYRAPGWDSLQGVFLKTKKEDYSFLRVHAGKRRPTRIFSKPLELNPEWGGEIGLATVQIQQLKWKLVRRTEGERIALPWWQGDGAASLAYEVRDYEVWTLENGVRLWVHQNPETRVWICTGVLE